MSTSVLKIPATVYFGENALDALVPILGKDNKNVLVFTDKSIEKTGILQKPISYMEQAGANIQIISDLVPEPTCDQVQSVLNRCAEMNKDIIVAIGGGSVMDIAKLVSVSCNGKIKVREMIVNPSLCKKTIRTIMIPTTAGTGAEATPNSIVTVPENELKVGIVNPEMIADIVILDASVTRKLPQKIAAATGVDALAHAIECYTSKKATPFSNMYALEALKLILPNIEKACNNPDATIEKGKMQLAAFYGGVAITASGTTAVHALSYPLGGKYHIPHGVANAIMLMPVLKYNKTACIQEFAEIYDAVYLVNYGSASREEKAERLLKRIEAILECLSLDLSLASYGVKKDDIDFLVDSGMQVERLLQNNKRKITTESARSIYEEVFMKK